MRWLLIGVDWGCGERWGSRERTRLGWMIGFDFGVFEGCFGGWGIFWAALSGVFGKGVAMAEEWAEWDRFPVGLKVLVVDDDDTCLTILKQKLLRCCYDGEFVSFPSPILCG